VSNHVECGESESWILQPLLNLSALLSPPLPATTLAAYGAQYITAQRSASIVGLVHAPTTGHTAVLYSAHALALSALLLTRKHARTRLTLR
jgi:hypothetical protein